MVANWDWVIYNFRLSLARALRSQGYDLVFVSPYGEYVRRLRDQEFRWIEWPLARRSLNPVKELASVWRLARIYEAEAPDIVHHDTIKPNFYGALASRVNSWRGVNDQPPRILNSFMGIGFLFSERTEARLMRWSVLPLMRFALQQDHVFTTFSNRKDRNTFMEYHLVDPKRTQLMVSEFVDTEQFRPKCDEGSRNTVGPPEGDEIVVLMAARLLWDKGVKEFVSAAEAFRNQNLAVDFWLAGDPDTGSPGYVPEEQLREWHEMGAIKWLGHRSDMPDLLRQVDIAVLPTHYNEGVPRFLVEAAATGLPLVATDIEACRRIVVDGENGFLIKRRDPRHLAEAIEILVDDPSIRQGMGRRSREKAVSEFAESNVLSRWLKLYEGLLGEPQSHE